MNHIDVTLNEGSGVEMRPVVASGSRNTSEAQLDCSVWEGVVTAGLTFITKPCPP